MRAGAIVIVVAASCSIPSRSEHVRTTSTAYREPEMWLCRPDLPSDACRIDLTTTVIAADGSHTIERHTPAVDAPVDCFYVYPTVDLNLIPGNHIDFSDTRKMAKAAAAQIARFSEVCNVYAPLYRQATIATYVSSQGDQRHFFDVAYSDIAAAFHAYMQHFDRGRPIVIIGHSQGSQMAAHLLRDTFDQSDQLRPRLLVAMTIGFSVDIPDGADTGGTFEHLAPCKTAGQTSCVVAYRTIADGDEPSSIGDVPAGHHSLCVDPSFRGVLSESVVKARDGITTPFESVRDFYRARCVMGEHGRGFLAIAEARVPNDKRPSLVDLGGSHGGLGLHVYDIQLGQGDLVQLIRTKRQNWAGRTDGDTVKP